MSRRHDTIGIKQAIRYEWMQKTTDLMLAGVDDKAIRQGLHEFLAERKSDGHDGKGSVQTRSFVVTNLMNIWVSPNPELVEFRNAALEFLRTKPSMSIVVHWSMISSAYPFWFNVARQTGRLLTLQDQVTHAQIISRLKEQYGDRQTISRYARYILRSLVAWGVLRDSKAKGCYKKLSSVVIHDKKLTGLIIESAMHAVPEGRGALGLLLNNPAFFPFQIPVMTGDLASQYNNRIEVIRYGLDDELLKLRADN